MSLTQWLTYEDFQPNYSDGYINLLQVYCLMKHFTCKLIINRKLNCFSIYHNFIIAYFHKVIALVFTFFCINGRKYWFRENFWLPVFDGFRSFEMSWTRIDYFWKMSVCVSVCVWQKFCGKCSSRTNQQNFIKFYI